MFGFSFISTIKIFSFSFSLITEIHRITSTSNPSTMNSTDSSNIYSPMKVTKRYFGLKIRNDEMKRFFFSWRRIQIWIYFQCPSIQHPFIMEIIGVINIRIRIFMIQHILLITDLWRVKGEASFLRL